MVFGRMAEKAQTRETHIFKRILCIAEYGKHQFVGNTWRTHTSAHFLEHRIYSCVTWVRLVNFPASSLMFLMMFHFVGLLVRVNMKKKLFIFLFKKHISDADDIFFSHRTHFLMKYDIVHNFFWRLPWLCRPVVITKASRKGKKYRVDKMNVCLVHFWHTTFKY